MLSNLSDPVYKRFFDSKLARFTNGRNSIYCSILFVMSG